MYCEKCGCILSADGNVCPICSKTINETIYIQNKQIPINTEIMQKPNDEVETEGENPEKYRNNNTEIAFIMVFAISFGLAIISTIITSSGRTTANLSIMSMICYFVALVTSVTAYIKFPKNNMIEVIFWFYVGTIIFHIVAFAMLIIVFMYFCNTCPMS